MLDSDKNINKAGKGDLRREREVIDILVKGPVLVLLLTNCIVFNQLLHFSELLFIFL